MVKALHGAGIEGILDVVSNHTAEGSHEGPMLSFTGIDDATYYRPSPEDRRFYIDAIHQDPVLSCASSSSLSRRGTR